MYSNSNQDSSNRTYRIKASVGNENGSAIAVQINQDIDMLELLSLKIDTTNLYKLHTSDYGCIAGRVLANGGVGIPNAKISVFIGVNNDTQQDVVLSQLYPYKTPFSKNDDGIRYNLLPDTEVTVCHTPVGTFPSKRAVLDDETQNTLFDKYYKFTTVSNSAGDYMLFGVPVGTQIVHTDIDLSDIGFLSQKPRDMIFKGYNITQFENANKFKYDTNLDDLTQLISQNDSINVYPFWGDSENEEQEIRITRNDISVQYKFEPTCVFIGSLITDEKSHGFSQDCRPSDRMGKMDRLTTGSGTIEMIRKTPDGSIESKSIQGNQLIDGNGTWCYQIPMNLDYYVTDEYGNLVPSDSQEKGIPTRTRVRFRFSLNDFQSDYEHNHLTKVLVPNNPKNYEDLDYHFGSQTMDGDYGNKSFRDLFWNNVYTVKSYIPRIQKGNNNRDRRFSGIKQVNVNDGNNPIPYNNIRVNLSFMFILQCAILKTLIHAITFINKIRKITSSSKKCTYLGDGICPDLENWYFAPGCPDSNLSTTLEIIRSEDANDTASVDYRNRDYNGAQPVCITKRITYLMQCIEINLAMEYNVIQFDFYNDWINGLIYIPRWFADIKKKKSYLFGLIKTPAKVRACFESSFHTARRYTQQCSLTYIDSATTIGSATTGNFPTYTQITTPIGCGNSSKLKCHTGSGRNSVTIFNGPRGGGLIHQENTMLKQTVYYAKPAEWLPVGRDFKRCILFATDIVLLGTLDTYEKHGIPKAFEELTSSTYKMPSNLAATNMDNPQFMLGYQNYGARCTGVNYFGDSKPIEPQPQTFDSYVRWSKNTDYYEAAPDDPTEYAITEAAGIDWGYLGPNQSHDNRSMTYQAGGHFLGISCTNAETNIKTCVNLSRICEIGATQSERQMIVGGSNGNDDLKYVYIIPTGLINKYNITDSSFRKMFATLNHNGLKTKLDEESGYLTYDFIPLLPNGFGGEMSKYVNRDSSPYNSALKDDNNEKNTKTSRGDENAAESTIENTSADYYRFRMGFTEENANAQKSRFLIVNGNRVSMPMYENSYYFYFGLKDGNTAIDRFFKDFYASCQTDDEDLSYFTIETIDANMCGNNDGEAKVSIQNVENPYNISLTKDGVVQKLSGVLIDNQYQVTIDENGNQDLIHNYSTFVIKDLPAGEYVLMMSSEDEGVISSGFVISNTPKGAMAEFNLEYVNFNSSADTFSYEELGHRQTVSYLTAYGGYIEFTNPDTSVWAPEEEFCFIVADENFYTIIHDSQFPDRQALLNAISDVFRPGYSQYMDCSGITDDTDSNKYYCPLWEGNSNYTVILAQRCNNVYSAYVLSNSFVEMPTGLDLSIGDKGLTVRKLLQEPAFTGQALSVFDTPSWIQTALTCSSAFTSDRTKLKIADALYFRDSMFTAEFTDSITLSPFGGVAPYNVYITGVGEEFVTEGNYMRKDISNGVMQTGPGDPVGNFEIYTLDNNDFMVPQMVWDGELNPSLRPMRLSRPADYRKRFSNNYGPDLAYGNFVKMPLKDNISGFTTTIIDNSGTTMTVATPSIYRPTFANVLVYFTNVDGDDNHIITDTGLETVNYMILKASVTNFMTFGRVQITVVPIADPSNPKEDTLNIGSGVTIETFLTSDGTYNTMSASAQTRIDGLGVGSFNVSQGVNVTVRIFEDLEAANMEDVITPYDVTESVRCTFPYVDTQTNNTQPQVNCKIYKAYTRTVGGEPISTNMDDYCWNNVRNQDLKTDYTTYEQDANSWYGAFGAEEKMIEDITVDEDNPQYFSASNGSIVAICDNWTQSDVKIVNEAFVANREAMFETVYPDTNIISVVRYYHR